MAMRYWKPTSDQALQELRRAGCDRLLSLTLYPHYSIATTGSSVNELLRAMKRKRIEMPLDRIDAWYNHPGYLDAMAARARAALGTFPAGATPTILVSAHGLPKHFIDAGDPYCDHIKVTMRGILDRLPRLPATLAYQSRVGPVEWIGPSTEEEIGRLAREGVKDLLVIPISFVSDHVETLYEIDLQYGEVAKQRGLRTFHRMESLNDFPQFLDALADLVEPKIR
jgi:ferrochelatase